jgi:hypothetical protein
MSLLNFSDIHSMSKVSGHTNKLVYKRIYERIHGLTGESPMPPYVPNKNPISEQDVAIIDGWLLQGAPSGQQCAPVTPPGAGGTSSGGTTNTGGRINTGGSVGSGGTAPEDDSGLNHPPPPDGDCTNIDITARSDISGTPFIVPANTSELYQCFNYQIDLKGATQALSFRPLIQQVAGATDGSPVIHHWLLYQATNMQTNGTSSPCLGFHPDGVLLAGWAPGAGDWNLPPTVGEEIGTGNFILEVHYNNYTTQDQTDQSGVRVCLAKTPRPNVASISWLGNDIFGANIPGASYTAAIPPQVRDYANVKGKCAPNLNMPVHILTSWPHMHKRGVRMSALINRVDGTQESLFDVPFDFNNQLQYETPAVINPGDSITTTCTYTNVETYPIGFGERTIDEMCFNFTLAYPAHALVGGGLHNNSCITAP